MVMPWYIRTKYWEGTCIKHAKRLYFIFMHQSFYKWFVLCRVLPLLSTGQVDHIYLSILSIAHMPLWQTWNKPATKSLTCSDNYYHLTWWCHQMETFSAFLALCTGIHRSPVNSPHKGQWHGALKFSLISAWINPWVNNHEACDLRRHRAHYDVTVMTNHSRPQLCEYYLKIDVYLNGTINTKFIIIILSLLIFVSATIHRKQRFICLSIIKLRQFRTSTANVSEYHTTCKKPLPTHK